MNNIDYIIKRLEEIYSQIVDEVDIIKEEHERTYRLHITLRWVHYMQISFEIDKNIQNVDDKINYIGEKINETYEKYKEEKLRAEYMSLHERNNDLERALFDDEYREFLQKKTLERG